MISLLIIVTVSYWIGSIPFGYILVRVFQNKDVRESGSGNIGATNVARSSPLLGLVTLLMDAGKGSAAVAIAMVMSRSLEHPEQIFRAALAACVVVIGHIFPVWLKFKGGKGVATALGSFALVAPKSMLIAAGIFVVSLLVFRYVSLSSILAVGLFPLIVWQSHENQNSSLVLALIAAASLVIVAKHHGNIRRLLGGNEPRFQLTHT